MKFLTLSFLIVYLSVQLAFGARKPYHIEELKQKIENLVVNPEIIPWERHISATAWLDDSTFYFNPEGSLHLFKIEVSDTLKVEKLSTSIYHGNTFGRLFFLKDGVPYQLGGSGLFTKFNGLIKFDFSARQWFQVTIKNQSREYDSIIYAWRYKNGILMMYNLVENNEMMAYGFLDLDEFQFTEFGRKKFELDDYKFGSRHPMDFSDGFDIFHVNRTKLCNYFIFDRNSGVLLEPAFLQDREMPNGLNTVYLKDSTIFFRQSSGEIDSIEMANTTMIRKVDLLGYFLERKNDSIESASILSDPKYRNFGVFLLAVTLLLLGVTRWIKKRRQSVKIADEPITDVADGEEKTSGKNYLSEFELKLEPLKGKVISRDELDFILGIASENQDLTKANRSRLIQSINANGNFKIERERDVNDKRVYRYSIQ